MNGGLLCLGAATTLRGVVKLYGGKLKQTSGAVTWNSGITGSYGEAVNYLFQSTSSGTAPFVLGTNTSFIDNLYNVDISHTTSNQIISNVFVTNARRVTVAGAAPLAFIQTGSPGANVKDLGLFGDPTNADIRWATAGAIDIVLVRPGFTLTGEKFSAVGVGVAIGDAAVEYRLYNVKCVDGTGAGVSGIPVKITDSVGNVQVNTTTDSEGRITFGSGITANAIAVADHYSVPSPYTIRQRGPFLVEINLPSQTGYNSRYLSHRYYHNVPGSEDVTTSAGEYEDINDMVQMEPIQGNPTTWVECSL